MTTYSISLDDVDLALLPLHSASNNFLKKQHFQFQLFGTERNEEASTNTQCPCHICAIDVPAAFLNEHFASVKHRINVRIATEASRRMRAFINSSLPPLKSQPSAEFCDSCSTIAGKEHGKTKEHTIAVIHDRMLRDLMKIYIGDDDLRTDDKGTGNNAVLRGESGIVISEVIGKHDDVIAQTITDNNNEADSTRNPSKAAVQNGEATVPNGTVTPDFLKIDSETYIKLLNNVPCFPKVAIQPVGDVLQLLVDHQKINVSSDHFHSYHRMEGKIQCRVCYCTITLAEEETHKLSVVHMKRVMRIVSDSHCVREIYANWCHCILCNQVVKSTLVEGHKLTQLHCEKKAIATVTEVQGSSTVRDVKDIQSIAGTSGTHAGQAPEANAKVTTKPHQIVATSKAKNMVFTNQYKSKEEVRIEYPYEATDNPRNVYCVLCACAVPSKVSNRVDHLKGLRHAQSSRAAKNN